MHGVSVCCISTSLSASCPLCSSHLWKTPSSSTSMINSVSLHPRNTRLSWKMHWSLPFFTHHLLDSTHTEDVYLFFYIVWTFLCIFFKNINWAWVLGSPLPHQSIFCITDGLVFTGIQFICIKLVFFPVYLNVWNVSLHGILWVPHSSLQWKTSIYSIYSLGLIWAGKLCGSYKLCHVYCVLYEIIIVVCIP